MAGHWTSEDIRRELHLGSRAAARKWIQRHRDAGVLFEVTIDPITSERYYADRMLINRRMR